MPRPCRILPVLVLAATAAAAQDRGQIPWQDPDRPNVARMMLDNLGCGEIGAFGGGVLRGAGTPRLDPLATGSTTLLNYDVQPHCTPSRSALTTGRAPIRSGTTQVVRGLPQGRVGSDVTLADLFSAAGYRTGMSGKWHLADKPGERIS